ncbi:MAG: hypothetical protein JWM11_731 [Planctomycetaceae bacterium]|nr:hypothetical protein [Planctomycetaceae bacterium]
MNAYLWSDGLVARGQNLMFYHSLALVLLLVLTAQVPFFIRYHVLFVALVLSWMLLWGSILFIWYLVISKPPAVVEMFLLLFSMLIISRYVKLSGIPFELCCLACVLIAYGYSMYAFLPYYRQHQRILAKYPMTDLKPRLIYERNIAQDRDSTSGKTADGNAPEFFETPHFDSAELELQELAFSQLEGGWGGYRRSMRTRAFDALNRAHADFVADFIEQPGLGFGRIPAMRILRESDLEDGQWDEIDANLPPKPIDQPQAPMPVSRSASETSDGKNATTVPSAMASKVAEIKPIPQLPTLPLQDYHRKSIVSFAPLYSFGGVKSNLEVRGFVPHAFRQTPESWDSKITRAGWRLSRLELVSLLKHQPPAVYVTRHLPAMDELRDAPTRATTKFELDAVSKLRAGEELVVDGAEETKIRMVGAIRALDVCRKCHQIRTGSLLGAFSYQFHLGPNPQSQ